MTRTIGARAIVIGAGVAGLTAARAISDHFQEVVILERDSFPAHATPRAGTPQSFHAHILLAGGLQALEHLFPGFERDLRSSGAVRVPLAGRLCEEVEYIGAFPQRDLGLYGHCMSRSLLERVIRKRVAALANVTLRQNCRAREILMSPDGQRVAGVSFDDQDGHAAQMPADLIVDASARGALTQSLLVSLGRALPEEATVGIQLGYATAVFAIPRDAPADWDIVYTRASPPNMTKAGLLSPIEGGRWIVTLASRHEEPAPADLAGFLSFARQLTTTTIHDAVSRATLQGSIRRFSFAESSWRHYEDVELPQSLIPVGDAICRFNPAYGQGMTVAAKEAVLLADLLRSAAEGGHSAADLNRQFLAAASPLISGVWNMSAVPDFAFPQTQGQRPPGLAESMKFGLALERAAVANAEIQILLQEVRHLMRPIAALRHPDIVRLVTTQTA